MSKIRADPPVRNDIDFPLQYGFQFVTEANQIEQTASILHFDQKINITFVVGLATRNGAENTDVLRSILSRNAKNFFAPGM